MITMIITIKMVTIIKMMMMMLIATIRMIMNNEDNFTIIII